MVSATMGVNDIVSTGGLSTRCHEHLFFSHIPPFLLRDYSCVDHMINIISSSLLLSLSFRHSALSMPITFRSYLAIILDHLSYCPMLLSFALSTQPLIYLIIFVLLTFRLIVLRSALFLLDVLLHLSLGIVPHCHSY